MNRDQTNKFDEDAEPLEDLQALQDWLEEMEQILMGSGKSEDETSGKS